MVLRTQWESYLHVIRITFPNSFSLPVKDPLLQRLPEGTAKSCGREMIPCCPVIKLEKCKTALRKTVDLLFFSFLLKKRGYELPLGALQLASKEYLELFFVFLKMGWTRSPLKVQ